MANAGLRLEAKKCALPQITVNFLRHIMTGGSSYRCEGRINSKLSKTRESQRPGDFSGHGVVLSEILSRNF